MAPKTTEFKRRNKQPVDSAISSTRKDVPSRGSLVFRAGPSSINVLQCEAEDEMETTVQIQIKQQLRCKIMISKEMYKTNASHAMLTAWGSSAAVAIASQMTP